jgi:hypothetical protein
MTTVAPEAYSGPGEWTDEVRAELDRLVDREIANVRARLPREHLVRQRYLAPTG